MSVILQSHLPVSVLSGPNISRLPGIQPLDPDDWLQLDDAYTAQMALRDQLIDERRDDVIALESSAKPAAAELLDEILQVLSAAPGYDIQSEFVCRPDGVSVPLDRSDPLATAGRLVQEDLCIMQKPGDEHVLSGAVLCFPAGWTLREKFMRPMTAIHVPVPEYDGNIARRVQRMFDAIRVEQPLRRANFLYYEDPTLYAPHFESAPRPVTVNDTPYVRSERQSLVRLPKTGAIIFSIHTYMVLRSNLTEEQSLLLSEDH